jgi:hypothetical protein
MSNSIRLYMWGYQQFYEISVRLAIQALVRTLDKDIRVETFLLGLHPNPNDAEGEHAVCLEPEDCGYSTSRFKDVLADAEHLFAVDPERNLIHSHAKVQAGSDRRRNRRSLQKAILKSLEQFSRDDRVRYYCSFAHLVNGYEVSIVSIVTFPEGGIPYEIPKIHTDERYAWEKSLFDIAMRLRLSHCANELHTPNPESVETIDHRRPEEIIHQAAITLLDIPIWATRKIEGMYSLFEAFITISSLRYEGGESGGGIIIARPDHPNIEVQMRLKNPIPVGQYRSLRKLLELSRGEKKLLCDGIAIFGLGCTKGHYNHMNADLFEVRFRRHRSWELLHDSNVMTRVEAGLATLAPRALNQTTFQSDVERILPQDIGVDADLLYHLAVAATGQGHGALIIIHPDAEQEALRLANQSTLVEPRVLAPSDIPRLSAIDGAILVDPRGTCFAIGVILDGLAVPEGDPGRGARFNSSLRYVASQTDPISTGPKCLAVIVSEDGDIQWIPELMPLLSRRKYEEQCAILRDVLAKKEYDSTRSNRILNWMYYRAFYLSAEICGATNELNAQLVAKRKTEGTVWMIRPELKPNGEMSDSYFSE